MIDWYKLFALDIPFLEIIIRGSCIYFALLFLLRILKRQAGAVGMSDLLVVVLIADAAQNGMAGEHQSITAAILLVATIVFWDYSLDWLSYRSPFVANLLFPQPVPLIKNGRILRKNMRSEFITEDELLSNLREQGVSDVHEVKQACMEGNGKISVVTFDKEKRPKNKKQTLA